MGGKCVTEEEMSLLSLLHELAYLWERTEQRGMVNLLASVKRSSNDTKPRKIFGGGMVPVPTITGVGRWFRHLLTDVL